MDCTFIVFQQLKTGNPYRILVETLKAYEDISKMDCTFIAFQHLKTGTA
jgi:uncharacterized protein YjhX (UPF0386 family)